jgi:hypothetical protein
MDDFNTYWLSLVDGLNTYGLLPFFCTYWLSLAGGLDTYGLLPSVAGFLRRLVYADGLDKAPPIRIYCSHIFLGRPRGRTPDFFCVFRVYAGRVVATGGQG